MKIQVGDMFRIKATGEILEITGDWFNSEYRYNSYSPDGIPCCGANGHHNISGNIIIPHIPRKINLYCQG